MVSAPAPGAYSGIVLAVAHEEFKALDGARLAEWSSTSAVVYDLKYILPRDAVDLRL